MKKDRIYVAIENQDSEFETLSNVVKIGISNLNSGGNKDPKNFHQRERALNQGNPRGIKVIHFRNIGFQARKVEQRIFNKLQYLGYENIWNESKLTGHREWWKINPNEAIRIVDEVAEKEFFIEKDLEFNDDDDNRNWDPDDWDFV